MHMKKSKSGQTMVEYLIIVGVIAIAALVVFGIFGDTIRDKVSGITSSLSEERGTQAQAEAGRSAADDLKKLDATGNIR